jgi:spermidine/putrescine-binding protein
MSVYKYANLRRNRELAASLPQPERMAAVTMSKVQGPHLPRRGVLAAGLGALAAPYLVRPARAKASELRILAWEGYAADPWVNKFEQAQGVECKITYVGSADEMFAKMVGSKGQDYDVVSFDTSAFARYLDSSLLQPVAMDRIPNAANIAPAFRDVAAVMRDGKQYGVPFAWGSLPLVYSEDAFPTAPESWEVMWDPQ